MLKPDKTDVESLESRMIDDKKKARRIPLAIITMLLLLGLIVGGWFTIDEWIKSGDAMPAVIKGAAWTLAFALMAAAGSSGQHCGDCWVRKLYQRVKRHPAQRG